MRRFRGLALPTRTPRDVLVLCYHAISDSWPADLAISSERFTRQLEFLLRRGYQGATFSDALTEPQSDQVLVVTFDDGYRSVLTRGKPILDRLGLPATVFVPTAFPAGGGALSWPGIDVWMAGQHEHELTPMCWQELAGLAAVGWEIGSHTISHPRLTQLSDERLVDELAGSREACARAIGRSCRSLAYPYGDVDDRVVSAARGAGYETAAALPARLHAPRPLQWPRIGAYSIDRPARFALKTSPTARRLRAALGPRAGRTGAGGES